MSCGGMIPGEVEFAVAVYKKRVKALESQLSSAKDALKEIREHEHIKSPCWDGKHDCPETGAVTVAYAQGIIDGHRCCAEIASRKLKELEGE
jgi:hypothetical protein